jgi:predicted  nucleic acid-binding Zn-ribbon protein
MPHQCIRCGDFYDDGAKEILTGCKCGSRFFFFVKSKDIEKAKNLTVNLTEKDREQIEVDVKDMIGELIDDKPVILDFENVRILKPGQYEISLIDIFKGKPLIYKLEDGKYFIDIVSTFESNK